MAAAKPGSEGIWWNPASIAQQHEKELAIHHSKTIAGVGDALSVVIPSSAGVIGLSLNILNLGDQQLKDEFDNVIGVILPRDVVLAGSYANALTNRLSLGMNYKLVQLRFDCSGVCGSVGSGVETFRAADLGLQFDIMQRVPFTVGIALRNVGGRLNSTTSNKRNPLPTQSELSAMYRLKFIDRYVKDMDIRACISSLNSRAFGGQSVRLGADIAYQEKVHLRGGYVGRDRRGEASAALGFGLRSGAFAFDIARTFGGLPADNGQAPVYASFRYLF